MLVSGVYHVCVYLYMCIHMYTHMCVYIYVYTCVYTYVYVCVFVYIYIRMYIYICMYVYIYILSQILFPYVHLCSVTQLCRILCDPMSLIPYAIQQVLVGYLSYI